MIYNTITTKMTEKNPQYTSRIKKIIYIYIYKIHTYTYVYIIYTKLIKDKEDPLLILK